MRLEGGGNIVMGCPWGKVNPFLLCCLCRIKWYGCRCFVVILCSFMVQLGTGKGPMGGGYRLSSYNNRAIADRAKMV